MLHAHRRGVSPSRGSRYFVGLATLALVGLPVFLGCSAPHGAAPVTGLEGAPDSLRDGPLEGAPDKGEPLTGAPVKDKPTVASEPAATEESASYLLFNQRFIEGLYADDVDPTDVDAMFWRVFSGLPDEVIVYPSENYYYFILNLKGQQIWGNIRLPAGKREEGVVSFGYFVAKEFPRATESKTGMSRSKFFKKEDGLDVESDDPMVWKVSYRGKSVVFNLYHLAQDPPKRFSLGPDETFIERTFDESGYQFFLIYNEKRNYFFWVLNEEPGVPDTLVPNRQRPELRVGLRSGFAFWVDKEHDNRKVLVAIRKLNSSRNDYYDGPFDQLADNYADQAKISEYMQRSAPALRGRIDKYGYYTDKERPMRVALACYYSYASNSDMIRFFDRSREATDFYEFVSRRGIPRFDPTKKLPPRTASRAGSQSKGGR